MPSRKRHPRWKYTDDQGAGKVSDLFPAGARFYPITDIDFFAWSPDPDPVRTPPTMLCIVFQVQGFAEERFLMRLKSPQAVDALIHELEQYRAAIWPKTNEKE